VGKRLILIILCAVLSVSAWAQQEDKYKFWTAGLHVRPLIPSNFLQTSTIEVRGNPDDGNEYMRMVIDQRMGFSFGMVVRKNFTQRFAMETGVNYVRRNYTVSATDLDSSITTALDYSLAGYEVPLMALVYIRLAEQVYMNTALGVAVDIMARSVTSSERYFDHYTAIRKVNGAVVANLGVEYRTVNSGTIYIGATYHQPTGPIGDTKINYFRETQFVDSSLETPLNGTYLTLDLRYYFHEGDKRRRRR
jgi:hypothetical protein